LTDWLAEEGRRVEAVVHMGAVSSTTECDVGLIVTTNFELPKGLWCWCTRADVPFIYASSAATYGDGAFGFEDRFTPEWLARLAPLNAYGRSKHMFDRWVCRQVSRNKPAPPQWAGLKFFNVYGPREGHKGPMRSVALQLFERAADSLPARLFRSHRAGFEDGKQRRDFVHVEDCVDVIEWLLRTRHVSGLFNVGSGCARTFLDLAEAVFSALDRPTRIEFIDMPEGIRDRFQYFTEANVTKIREAGFPNSFRSLEAGVASYVRDYLRAGRPSS
jgi:ADP-L-glycero-D-manno-heptose 6-epimerase